MVFLFFSLLVWLVLFFGIGNATCAMGRVVTIKNPFIYTWVGFATTLILAGIINIFFPINLFTFLLFSVFSIYGIYIFYKKQQWDTQILTLFFPLLFILLICISIKFSLSFVYEWDTNSYHLPMIEWIQQSSLIKGIANLNIQYAWPTAYFQLASLIDTGIFEHYTTSILIALVFLLTAGYFLYEILYAKPYIKVYSLVFIYFIFTEFLNIRPTLYYDIPAYYLAAIAHLEALKLYIEDSDEQTSLSSVFIMLLFIAAAFAIKPTAGMLVVFGMLLAIYVFWKKHLFTLKNCVQVLTLPFLACLGFFARNIYYAGYIFYPKTWGDLGLDWAVSDELTNAIYDSVHLYEALGDKSTGMTLENNFDIYISWLERYLSDNMWLYSILLLGIILCIATFFSKSKYKAAFSFFLVWTYATLAFCFTQSPILRYAIGYYWIAYATLAVFMCLCFAPNLSLFSTSKNIQKISYAFMALCLCYTGYTTINWTKNVNINIFMPQIALAKVTEKVTLPNGQEPPFTLYRAGANGACGTTAQPCFSFDYNNFVLYDEDPKYKVNKTYMPFLLHPEEGITGGFTLHGASPTPEYLETWNKQQRVFSIPMPDGTTREARATQTISAIAYAQIQGLHGTVTKLELTDKGSIYIESASDKAALVLINFPQFSTDKNKRYLIEFNIENSQVDWTNIYFYNPKTETFYINPDYHAPIYTSKNLIPFMLIPEDAANSVLISPNINPGQSIIHKFDVIEVEYIQD